jgi:hypothetical protein
LADTDHPLASSDVAIDVENSSSDGLDLEVSSASGGSSSACRSPCGCNDSSELLVPASVARPLDDVCSVGVPGSSNIHALASVGGWSELEASIDEPLVSASGVSSNDKEAPIVSSFSLLNRKSELGVLSPSYGSIAGVEEELLAVVVLPLS